MEHDTEEPSPPSVKEVGDRMKEDFQMLREATSRRREEVIDQARRYIEEHPIASVAIAFGVGFALSGGLVSKTTGKIVKVGVKWYAGRLLRDLLAQSARQALGFQEGER